MGTELTNCLNAPSCYPVEGVQGLAPVRPRARNEVSSFCMAALRTVLAVTSLALPLASQDSIATGEWTAKAPLPAAREEMVVGVIDGKL